VEQTFDIACSNRQPKPDRKRGVTRVRLPYRPARYCTRKKFRLSTRGPRDRATLITCLTFFLSTASLGPLPDTQSIPLSPFINFSGAWACDWKPVNFFTHYRMDCMWCADVPERGSFTLVDLLQGWTQLPEIRPLLCPYTLYSNVLYDESLQDYVAR